MSGRPCASLLGACLLLAATAGTAAAQGRTRCTLFLEGTTPESRSVSFSDPGSRDTYITHMSHGMVGRCGDATMLADSAIDFDRHGRLELYDDVRYRDTIRTLESELLTYFEAEDRIVAEVDVVLTRLRSGSVLRGPRVEFFRVPAVGDRTVATGRPHMTLHGFGAGPDEEPFEVDADHAEFEGERSARARGEVVIRRSDLDATADSAVFDLAAGEGTLYGSPVVRGEAFELTGDSVRVLFVQRALREVHGLGQARAVGERFDLRSEHVKARIADGEVEELWAFGGPRALGTSGGYRLWGDSLRFLFTRGGLDSAAAVGRAAAVEGTGGEVSLAAGPHLAAAEGSNWLAGDTIRARFAPAAMGAGEEAAGGEGERPLERLHAVGRARSHYAAVRDTTRTGRSSRNYLVGQEIEVSFRDGEAREVTGRDAVGIYLEPEEALGEAPAEPPATPSGEPAAEEPAAEERGEGNPP